MALLWFYICINHQNSRHCRLKSQLQRIRPLCHHCCPYAKSSLLFYLFCFICYLLWASSPSIEAGLMQAWAEGAGAPSTGLGSRWQGVGAAFPQTSLLKAGFCGKKKWWNCIKSLEYCTQNWVKSHVFILHGSQHEPKLLPYIICQSCLLHRMTLKKHGNRQ